MTDRTRFIVMNTARLSGALLVLLGILVIEERLDAPAAVGFVLVAFGLFEFFFLPTILARRWKSRGE